MEGEPQDSMVLLLPPVQLSQSTEPGSRPKEMLKSARLAVAEVRKFVWLAGWLLFVHHPEENV